MQSVAKAITALLVAGITYLLVDRGLPVPENLEPLITAGVTSFFVWLVPNSRSGDAA